MELAAKLDEIGKPAWIALMVVGFVVAWPLGLAVLGYLLWSGRMGCWKNGRLKRWQNGHRDGRGWFAGSRAGSGNRAFDEYREETLRRLEEEQREFSDYLDRLRFAKDKAEFDQFMSERRRRDDPEPQPQG